MMVEGANAGLPFNKFILENRENPKIECTFGVVTFVQKQLSKMFKNQFVGCRGTKKV